MKNSTFSFFSGVLVATTGFAIGTVAVAPSAMAYDIGLTGDYAGNPSGPLYKTNLTTADIGKTFNLSWLVPQSNKLRTDLTAEAVLDVVGLTAQWLELNVSLTNTTSSIVNGKAFKAAIVSLGFGVDPNATSAQLTTAGNVFDTTVVQNSKQQQFPGGFKQIDVCIFATGCSGGNLNAGLQAGATDSFSLKIFGNFNAGGTGPAVSLSDFPIKFQTDDGSYEPPGVPSEPEERVPEPITLLGSALAMGFAPVLKREAAKRKVKSAE